MILGYVESMMQYGRHTKYDQDVTVTNDGATILSLLDVEHPAGKILVDLAQQQDKEVSISHTSVKKLCSYCSGRRRHDLSSHNSS